MPDDPDEEFQRIIEHLDFDDVEFPTPDTEPHQEQPPEPRAAYTPQQSLEAGFTYPVARSGPINIKLAVAWLSAIIAPLALVFATMSGVLLPRPIAYGCALLFIAAVLYLFSQIPKRDDDSDDGAVL